jgi:hypothetical protein
MKRTAVAFVLAAGLGGCMSPSTGTKPMGTKTDGMATAKAAVKGDSTMTAGRPKIDSAVVQASALGVNSVTRTGRTGMYDPNVQQVFGGRKASIPPEVAYGPSERGIGTMLGHGGITPAPPMGPPGAVALIPGAAGGPGGGPGGSLYANGRTSVRFASPAGMRIAFQDASGGFADSGREAPVRYNFVQGNIYRVRLNGIPIRPGKNYYPTLEIYGPTNKESMTFLSHSAVPVAFTDDDFDQVNAGNMLVKVIYLPNAQFQDVAAAEEIVSTKLQPGEDPVAEAMRRGTILAVVRCGNIDLEDPTTPAMDAPPGSGAAPRMGGMGMGGMPAPTMMTGPAMPAPIPTPDVMPGPDSAKKTTTTTPMPVPTKKDTTVSLPPVMKPTTPAATTVKPTRVPADLPVGLPPIK